MHQRFPGISSATADLPSGSVIRYLCTYPWYGTGNYNFSSWTFNNQNIPGGSCFTPNLTVTGSTTIAVNYNQISTSTYYPVTILTAPSAASNYWGACFSTAYNGSNQTCTSDSPGISSATADLPSGSVIRYLCTYPWYGTGNYNFSSWTFNNQNIPGGSCLTPNLTVTGSTTIAVNYNVSSTSFNSTASQIGNIPITSKYTISLNPGWNLLSTPITDEISVSDSPSGCASNDVKSPVWEVVNGNYITENSTLQAGVGYWIDMNSGCQISLSGTAFTIQNYSILNSGWNTIGAPINITSINAIRGSCVIIGGPYGYHNNTGYYNATSLQPGNGYLINVANSCRLGNYHAQASQSVLPPSPP